MIPYENNSLPLIFGFSLSSQASSLFEQLCTFNPNWNKHKNQVPIENGRVFLSDKQYIQTHLELVLQVLRSADLASFNENQLVMRKHLIAVLSDYRLQGEFPLNYYRSERISVLIQPQKKYIPLGK